MAHTPFSSGSSNAAMHNNSYIGPEGRPDVQRDGAPAGRFFSESELPVVPSHGANGFREGFSPSPMNAPLPAPGSSEGSPLPPSGERR